ncbi:DUF2076 domain-containing protein [Buchnera aphidicola (Macrosiphoniella sanborni)]|uniref:DUF2076 domain-containing protein n=1 Tax=Buchnera aphidicola (Macrosiphoniella sanborni) TaxID=1241865 RepID=A0A4D6Y2K5_9GAMM|nr:DUF2076 domain-containing protein [Buchnera aphidicola]QCI23736.1 DUF2076 domain-containing protein [Buchnera aphidicola (Macrosiphoniella sanborni)]
MKDKEKNLIENLFYRLKNTELNMSERDVSADNLIQNLVSKQPSSPYYMTQTILIQETAIKKMGMKIEELEKRIQVLNQEISNKKPSFLSSFFKKNTDFQSSQPMSNNIWRNKENISQTHATNLPPSSITQPSPIVNNTIGNSATRSSGFLSSALQTATGVAGGMILGNMLMSAFNHVNKPEEEIFDTVNKFNQDDNAERHFFDNHTQSDLVNYQSDDIIDSNKYNECTAEDFSSDVDDVNNFDTDDDNFI